VLWLAAWAPVPWLNAGANLLLDTGERSAIWEESRVVVIVDYAVSVKAPTRIELVYEALQASA
jgi:hypothetical protein